MEKLFLIILTVFWISELKAQCDECGKYSGNSKHRWQELLIKEDSTFTYTYSDNRAALMGGTTTGTWKRVGNEIELNSQFNNTEYEVVAKNIDLCKSAPKYLMANCKKLSQIQVANLDDEFIWQLRSVMINNDTAQISLITFDGLKNTSASMTQTCFFFEDSISKVNIFNGFYDEFVISIDEPHSNYVRIKGNFADEPWYTYIIKERWKIKNKKLVGNEKFGNFVKQRKR